MSARQVKSGQNMQKKFERVCRYYGTIPYDREPQAPLSRPLVDRAVRLVQKKVLSQLIDERLSASIKEAKGD